MIRKSPAVKMEVITAVLKNVLLCDVFRPHFLQYMKRVGSVSLFGMAIQ